MIKKELLKFLKFKIKLVNLEKFKFNFSKLKIFFLNKKMMYLI